MIILILIVPISHICILGISLISDAIFVIILDIMQMNATNKEKNKIMKVKKADVIMMEIMIKIMIIMKKFWKMKGKSKEKIKLLQRRVKTYIIKTKHPIIILKKINLNILKLNKISESEWNNHDYFVLSYKFHIKLLYKIFLLL